MGQFKTKFGGNFNAEAVEPQASFGDFEPLPPGVYEVEIVDAAVAELKSGQGIGLKLEYAVISPREFQNRKVWQNLNIKHTSEKAEQIGQAQLSALCHAVGITQLDDEDKLFQKLLKVKLKIRPAEGGYKASNEVIGIESMTVAGVTHTPAAAQGATPARPPASRPWDRK